MDTDDLLLRVRRRGASAADAGAFVAELWTESGRRFEPEPISLGSYRDTLSTDPREIAAQGLDLFNRLFVGRLAVAFQQAWAAAGARGRTLRLRLALDAGAPQLHAIPWELMHFDDSGGLSPPRPLAVDPRVSFSRYIELADFDEAEPVAERPVRMLAVISAPNDLERWGLAAIDKAAEERDLRTRFSPIDSSGQFRQDFLARATAEELERALSEGAAKPGERPEGGAEGYHVLLYIGHALHHDELGSFLVLEDEASGRVNRYDGAELVSFLKNLPRSRRPAMVVLVACNSASVAGDNSLNSLAARLVIDADVPVVLAMQRLVEITLARAFTFHLSEQLLRDGLIDGAVAAARRRVFQHDSLSWSTPVLYMRHRDGRLFTPNAKLDYVEQVLRDPEILRWSGPEFINLGVLAIAPGQDWKLLRYRPEDAPATIDVLEAAAQSLGLAEEREGRERRGRTPPSNLLALIGPPHSGQTTVLRRLCHDLAEAVTHDLERPAGLLISLAGYDQQRGGNRLERHITELARAVSPALGEELAELFRPRRPREARAEQVPYVFLLDDLDALPAAYRLEAARELAALAARLPRQRFVVTSTHDAYPGQLLPSAQVLVIQPLNERRVVRYLQAREPRQAQQIFQQIRDNRLIALATDPSLLAMIYERLAPDPLARVTRNQLAQEYLDRRLGGSDPRYALGDAARDSLSALAWYTSWNHLEVVALPQLFRVLAEVRRDRDYSLEELYGVLAEARLLTSVGQHAARFVNPALHAYCAAVHLADLPDSRARLADIVTLCGSPDRLSWWEDVLYFYAGLVADPAPLLERLAAAIRAGSSTHALLAARCLEAVPQEHDERVPETLRAELLDACVLRLRSDREPLAERREQIVIALGRLSYHQVRHELRRILVERVRSTSSGPRYEYTNVRIAAARALRNIYSARPPAQPSRAKPRGADDLVFGGYSDQAGLASRVRAAISRLPNMDEIRDDQMLVRLMRIWQKGPAGRDEFLSLLRNSPQAPERALAAFAIGDMGDSRANRLRDVKQLLRVIVSPGEGAQEVSEEWEDTMWAAADALTLFETDQVTPLLEIILRQERELSEAAAQQLAYLAGRVRSTGKETIDWLIRQLIANPSQSVKAKALQSLAWMGAGLPSERLLLPDGRPGPTLKELVENIAAWRPIAALERGTFTFAPRRGDEATPTYLRRKAIEALAWIGDRATLEALDKAALEWPIELREHWYQSAATIRSRLGRG